MDCPVCEEELEFRSSSRSPTKYAKCPGCGTFINFSLMASVWLDTEAAYVPPVLPAPPAPLAAPVQPPAPAPPKKPKSLYEKMRDGEL